MPNVVREDTDNLNAVLKVVIGREDYEPKFNQELKKISKTASLKGFRKGKTPLGFLKKMYGKGLLSDIVTEMLQEGLSETINDEKTNFIGRPIPVAGFRPVDFDVDNMEDYEFKFDIGKAPDFELKGADGDVTYDFFKVEVPSEKVDEQIEMIRKRNGTRADSDEPIREDDLITFNASELENGKLKEDGWKTTFNFLPLRMEDEALKKELMGKKKGDTVRFNIYKLEKDAKPEYVKKYLLNLTDADIEEGTEVGEEYEAIIENVSRLQPAELTQELFDKVFGEGKVSTEAEARDIISKSLGNRHETTSNTILYRDIRYKLVELNREAMPLPNDYLKRWVEVGYEDKAPAILENFEDFTDDMRWNLIKNKLFKQFALELNDEDLKEAAFNKVLGYFGGQYQPGMEQMIDSIVERMLSDSEQVNNLATEVLSNKLFFKLKEQVGLNNIVVSAEALSEKMAALQLEEEARNAKLKSFEAEEEEE